MRLKSTDWSRCASPRSGSGADARPLPVRAFAANPPFGRGYRRKPFFLRPGVPRLSAWHHTATAAAAPRRGPWDGHGLTRLVR